MKVFISYGDASDQVTALRLQALGAVNGLTVYVPPAFTRQGTSAPALQLHFGSNLVVIDPDNPGAAEVDIVRYLKSVDAQQSAKTTLVALGALALGLLILAPADQS
jgi:hypothetical protein